MQERQNDRIRASSVNYSLTHLYLPSLSLSLLVTNLVTFSLAHSFLPASLFLSLSLAHTFLTSFNSLAKGVRTRFAVGKQATRQGRRAREGRKGVERTSNAVFSRVEDENGK